MDEKAVLVGDVGDWISAGLRSWVVGARLRFQNSRDVSTVLLLGN